MKRRVASYILAREDRSRWTPSRLAVWAIFYLMNQTLCACQDNRMFLELLIECQARHIAQLQRRLGTHEPFVMNL